MPDRIRGEDREQLTNGLELDCLRSETPIRWRFLNLDGFVPFPHAKPKLPGITLWRGCEFHLHVLPLKDPWIFPLHSAACGYCKR